MKTNIATTIQQSERLLRCGVSADTADMFYQTPITVSQKATREDILLERKADETLFDTDTPAWSLSALLTKVLPHNISVDKYKYKGATEYEVGCYFTGHRDKIAFNAPDPIEACVQLIEWLTTNGYKSSHCPCREKGVENE